MSEPETVYLMEIAPGEIFSIPNPENLDEYVKDQNGQPYRLDTDGLGNFSLEGGGVIPNDNVLKKLLDDSTTKVHKV